MANHHPSVAPWPTYTGEEADAVRSVLMSNRVNYWTVEQDWALEGEFADLSGTNRAIALANCTVALDVAISPLKTGTGDEVIVTP